MNQLELVYSRFLSLITDYSYLELTEEELEIELETKLEIALSKLVRFKPVTYSSLSKTFSRELTSLEITILAHALLVEWLAIRVYNVKQMEYLLSSKDFNAFSSANHLKEMSSLQLYAEEQCHYLMKQYTLFKVYGDKLWNILMFLRQDTKYITVVGA